MRIYRLITFLALIFAINNVYSSTDSTGVVSGIFELDDTWEPMVYLSVISTFNDMYKMSNKMIISESQIDNNGNFKFNISFLKEESLLRIHIVKKGNPATTLVIGGKTENHFFFIAESTSNIYLQNQDSSNIFHSMIISGSPQTVDFNKITELSSYPELLNYNNIILEKDIVKQVVNERLKLIADTFSNQLLSLYALYKIESKIDFYENSDFYELYLKKWADNESSYFKAFKGQFPKKKVNIEFYLIILLIVVLSIGFIIFHKIKNNKFKKLSLQERKIYELLLQGASNQEISDECHIEISTVKTHVSNIFSKLKIRSRKEIIDMK